LPTNPGLGDGTLAVTPTTVTSGSVVTLTGTGFVERPEGTGEYTLKINDGKGTQLEDGTLVELKFPTEQPDGITGADGSVTVTDQDHMPDANGTFSVQVALPDFPEDGQYWIRILAGSGDGGVAVSKFAAFTVDDHQVAPVEREITLGTVATASTGVVTVGVSGSGFTPGAALTAAVAGTDATWAAGRGTAPSLTIGEDGTFSGTVNVPAGAAPAGENTLTLTSSEDGDTPVSFTSTPGISFANGSAASSTSDVTALNLPTGAVVTGIGVVDANWITGSHTVEEGTSVTIPGVTIPAGTTSGSPVVLTYSVGGSSLAYTTSVVVTPDNSPVNEDAFATTSAELPSGLYQSAYNPETKTLFATSSVGRPPILESQLVKIDPETLEVTDSVVPAVADEETGGLYGVYGIGLDNDKGYVWVTNTRQNTVAVYDQETLELVTQFPDGSTTHSRDVVIDESTHLAYVSSSTGDYVDVYSGAGDAPVYVERITVSSESQAFDVVMSLDLDQETGVLYTTSLNNPVAAAIDTRNGNAVTYYSLGDHVASASGVAYDPVAKNLFIASQATNNVVVVNTVSGKLLADIPTGAGALNAVYDETTGLVYVSNRGGGTVTIINASTLAVVGNVPAGTNTNHVSLGDGVAFAVDKGSPNLIHRIVPQENAQTATSTLPTSGDDLEASLDLGEDALSNSSPEPGEEITITVGTEYAGQLVDVHLFSDPTNLTPDGVVVADDGTVTATLPEDATAVDHRIAVANRYGLVLGWASLTVQGDEDGTDDGGSDNGTDEGTDDNGTDEGTDDGNGSTAGSGNGSGSSTDTTSATGSKTTTSGKSGLADTGFDPSLMALAGLLVLGGAGLTLTPRLRARR
jgi:hypothetical protein